MNEIERCAAGVFRLRTLMANVYFIAGGSGWVLVDAGLNGYAASIRGQAEHLFGKTAPSAIILTHGHFDHIGSLRALLAVWQDAPVYAHPLELPYLTGRSAYPPPDPSVGGGLWSRLSATFPRGPIDIGRHAQALPADGSVPGLLDWRWIATPGHTAGHVSLFRNDDRTLVAGDAVVTTRQESLWDVLTQREMVWRPPAYYTSDWGAARRSIATLAALEPEVLATGHGRSMRGAGMRHALTDLLRHFDEVVPAHGRYVGTPAIADERGVISVPAPAVTGRRRWSLALTVAGAAGAAFLLARARGSARPPA